jgi:catechol 2,3-dioxygenase-like lactoylglutathione lyase family enzyme
MRSTLRGCLVVAPLALLLTATAVTAQPGPPNESGASIAAVYLTVRDPEAHAAIWRESFGVDVVPLGTALLVRIPGVFLVLERGEPTAGSDGASVDHEGFLVPSYPAVKALLEQRGFPITLENADNRQVTFEFPDGIKFEFSEAQGLSAPVVHHHVHLFVTDPEAVRHWYAKAFGATQSARGQFLSAIFPGTGLFDGAEACGQPAGDFRCPRIDFARTGQARAANTGRSLDRIGVEVRRFDETLRRLRAEGISVEVAEQGAGTGLRRAVIVDPEGTRIVLTEGLAGL